MNPFEKYAFPIIENVTECRLSLEEYQEELTDFGHGGGLLHRIAADGQSLPEIVSEEPLNEETVRRIDGLIEEGGFEVLAYYKSPHFLNFPEYPGRWGIFIYQWALRYLAGRIRSHHPNSWQKLVMQAYWFLCGHERYHWYVDAWTIDKEALLGMDLYRDYHEKVYRNHFPGGCFEEALANCNARSTMRLEGIREFMDAFMDRQPGMYSRYWEDKDMLRSHLAGQILDRPQGPHALTHERPELGPWLATSLPPILKAENCPVYLIKGRESKLF